MGKGGADEGDPRYGNHDRLLVLAPGVSAHAGGAVGRCPDSYQLTHTFKDDPVDLNGDRWIYERPLPSPDSNHGGQGTSLVIDNVLTQ
jgi:hypothetical protein